MYHFRVKVIGRSSGRSAAGAGAYRTGGRSPGSAVAYRTGEALRDPLSGRRFDYRAKGRVDADGYGVLHTEILAPKGAPDWVFELQALLDKTEAAEKRRDAQYFRELEISLPRELSLVDQKALIRAFVDAHCVRLGMVAVIAIHNERAADGGSNPHAHVILSMRTLTPDGFGPKVRAWNARELVHVWREAWSDMANAMLKARGFETRLDHRAFRDREVDLEPDVYVGPTKAEGAIIMDARAAQREEVKARNYARAAENPAWFLEQITRLQSTFTTNELASLVRRYTGLAPNDPRAAALCDAVLTAPDLMRISSDLEGPARYTTRSLFECEVRLAKTAELLGRRLGPAPAGGDLRGLSAQQKRAARHLLGGPDLVALEGVAGAGKTYLLARVCAAFEGDGRRVRGLALSAIVARNLGHETGMPAQTVASFLKDLARPEPYAPLQRGDVLVLDEAGLVGSRQLEAIVRHVERAKAKLVLVGDTRQLQSIEAGAAFRALVQRHGAARLDEVRRQSRPRDRDASADFAKGKTAKALQHYRQSGAFVPRGSQCDAMRALVFDWLQGRRLGLSQLILAHRRADAGELNRLARLALRAEGLLGTDVSVSVSVLEEVAGVAIERRETRAFAVGDDILFTRNEFALGVQNGATGRLTAIKPGGEFRVTFADGRVIALHPSAYPYLEQGYAMTVHKAQGATVDRAYVLASHSFDAHLSYVAMTRHRDSARLYFAEDEFEGVDLIASLSRERPKDMAIDYLPDAPSLARDAERVGVEPPIVERADRGLGRD